MAFFHAGCLLYDFYLPKSLFLMGGAVCLFLLKTKTQLRFRNPLLPKQPLQKKDLKRRYSRMDHKSPGLQIVY